MDTNEDSTDKQGGYGTGELSTDSRGSASPAKSAVRRGGDGGSGGTGGKTNKRDAGSKKPWEETDAGLW